MLHLEAAYYRRSAIHPGVDLVLSVQHIIVTHAITRVLQ